MHLFHRYKVVKETRLYSYRECKCGARIVKTLYKGGYSGAPDQGWLRTGVWSKKRPPKKVVSVSIKK